MTTYFRYAFMLMAMFCFVACSDDDTEGVNEQTATDIFNEIKGTYEGKTRVGNDMWPVTIMVANDEFTIKQLPVLPIIQRIFTSQHDQEEALKEVGETTTFVAPITNLGVVSSSAMLGMEPTDLVLTLDVGGEHKQISALIESYASWVRAWGNLSVKMNVVELNYDGNPYSLTDNRIEYFIDMAQKPE